MSTNTATSLEQVRLEQLRPHPQNIRFDVGDVTGLAEDIKSNGVLVPLVVAPHPQLDGDYIVIGGHRRLAASKQAGVAAVPCVIRHDLTDTAAQLETMIQENINRENLSPVEEAKAYQSALNLGVDVQRVAKASGRSQKTVKERLKLNTLNDGQRDSLSEGTLTIEKALVLADFAGDEEATTKLEEAATSKRAADWEVAVKREQKRRAWAEGIPALKAELTAAGVTVIERPEGYYHSWEEYKVLFEYSADLKNKPYSERAELGHMAIVDNAGPAGYYEAHEIVWVETPKKAQPIEPREPSPEEIADEKQRTELSQGLQLAAHVREEQIVPAIRKPEDNQAANALADLIINRCGYDETVHLCTVVDPKFPIKPAADGEDFDEVDAEQTLRYKLEEWPAERLAMILHYLLESREESLRRLHEWNPNAYYTWRPNSRWIDALDNVYGYELSAVEAAAIEYHTPKERDEDA